MGTKKTVVVVPHTHWDREWYLAFEEFRFLLAQALDRVLRLLETDEDFLFTLDGQTIPLLDYLAVFPGRREELVRYIREGRLKVGPWYIQPDEFLVSGESLIRNLLFGIRLAEEFGGAMRVGYLPDAFGHIAQLPQILGGFGIDTVFLMRGADLACEAAGGPEFRWQAPDGTIALVHVLKKGYGVIKRLSDVRKDLVECLSAHTKTDMVLLPVGGDHLAPQPDFLKALEELRARFGEFLFRIGTFEDYAEALRRASEALPIIEGELRASRRHFILAGVLSTRIYLKQANFRVQNLLERYAEPLAAVALRLADMDLRPWLRLAWQILLENHAHDSICGTCIDPVHREMLVRFEKAGTLGNLVVHKAVEGLSRTEEKEPCIVVFNPCPWPRGEEIEALVPKKFAEAILEDQEGTSLDAEQGEVKLVSEGVLEGVKHEEWVTLKFWDALPPMGFKVYRLRTGKKFPRRAYGVEVRENSLENEHYRVIVAEDGTFTLVDKETSEVFPVLHILEDEGDAGDEYNFSPPRCQSKVVSRGLSGKIKPVLALPWKGALRVEAVLEVPCGLSPDRSSRSNELVELPFSVTFSLQKGLKRLDVVLELENRACDHRLRVAFPTGIPVSHAWAEDSFWVIKRPVRPLEGADWVEKPAATHPQKSFVIVEDGQKGFALLNRGLFEYEVSEEGTIYLTLLRCVGWLSRDDLSTRRGHAGPPYLTPEAQCPGSHRFEYAVHTYQGPWFRTSLLRVAQEFSLPPRGFFAAGPFRGPQVLLKLDPPSLILSAFKPAEEGAGTIVRIYNPTPEAVEGKLYIGWPAKEVWEARLDETPLRKLSRSETQEISLALRAGEIKTLRVT